MKILICCFFISLLCISPVVFSGEDLIKNEISVKGQFRVDENGMKIPVPDLPSGQDTMHLSKKELEVLIKKAEQGDVVAATALGMRYDLLDRRYDKAVYWMEFAAKKGYPLAQYNLGLLLLRFDSEDKFDDAIKWLELAEKNGMSDARFDIDSALKRNKKRNAVRENKK